MGKIKTKPKRYISGAFRAGHRAGVRDFIDHDEFSKELLRRAKAGDKEAAHALEWIALYNNEVYKGFLKKGDENALHNTKALYKKATDEHNARRRDFFYVADRQIEPVKAVTRETISPADPVSCPIDDFVNSNPNLNHEDTMIELISARTERQIAVLIRRKVKITNTK